MLSRTLILTAALCAGVGGAGASASAQAPSLRPLRSAPLPAELEQRLRVELGASAPFPTAALGQAAPRQAAPVASNAPKPLPVASSPPETPRPATQPITLGSVLWRQDYESLGRRPIQTARFGDGQRRVLVLSNLSGNSEPTVTIAEQLAGLFARDELVPLNLSVLVVRTPNPDGLANRTHTNARGVDLNRNFPTRRFTAQPTVETGRPGSEPETRAIMNLMHQFRPETVIHLVESRSTRGMIRTDDLDIRELLPSYSFMGFEHNYKDGSLAQYTKQILERNIVEVELPPVADPQAQRESLTQLMVLILDQSVNNVRSQMEPRNLASEEGSETTLQAGQQGPSMIQQRPDGARGYVEFLPPPPDAPAEPSRPRYIELPPPPE